MCGSVPPGMKTIQEDAVMELEEDLRLVESTVSRQEPAQSRVTAEDTLPKSRTREVIRPWRVSGIYPVIPGRLYWTAHEDDEMTARRIEEKKAYFYFSSGLQDAYAPFNEDFGPVDLCMVHDFCTLIREKLQDERLKKRPLIYYCSNTPEAIANTVFLCSAFLVLECRCSPEIAVFPFIQINPSPFKGFCDIFGSPDGFEISLLDCCKALHQSVQHGWFELSNFDREKYEALYDPSVDMNQICDKFIAMRGPVDDCVSRKRQGTRMQEASHALLCNGIARDSVSMLPILQYMHVEAVVRLNDPATYDPAVFEDAGIKHYDLYFEDCTAPTDEIIERFFDICQRHKKIAVHCVAGLGRTGTLIALWLMKEYDISAKETIAWLRIVRPGSVFGVQERFLERQEAAAMAQASAPQHSSVTKSAEAHAIISKRSKRVEERQVVSLAAPLLSLQAELEAPILQH